MKNKINDNDTRFSYKDGFKEFRTQNAILTKENINLKELVDSYKKENNILSYNLQNYEMEIDKIRQNYNDKEKMLVQSLKESEQDVSFTF